MGLLALMLLNEARRTARTTSEGELIPLEEQDRTQWHQVQIAEGAALVRQVFSVGPLGRYSLQAAIAAVHAVAPTFAVTNWVEIVGLYDLLLQVTPSPIVELNRAVAVAMRDGAAAGLALINAILSRGDLVNYHLAYAARADLYRRLGQTSAARTAYQQAIALDEQGPERRFLERRLHEL